MKLAALFLFVVACSPLSHTSVVVVKAADGLHSESSPVDPCHNNVAPALSCSNAACVADTAAALQHLLAPFDVTVLAEDTSLPHSTVVLTSGDSSWCDPQPLRGRGTLTGQYENEAGVAYVFGAGQWPNADAAVAMHEFGHIVGLEHVRDCHAVMRVDATQCDATDSYVDQDFDTMTDEFRPQQNEYQMMLVRLGARP